MLRGGGSKPPPPQERYSVLMTTYCATVWMKGTVASTCFMSVPGTS